jgi:hypothetical protein
MTTIQSPTCAVLLPIPFLRFFPKNPVPPPPYPVSAIFWRLQRE